MVLDVPNIEISIEEINPPFIKNNKSFPAKTPIKTNHGTVFIENLQTDIHTINHLKILKITQTYLPNNSTFISFKKNSIRKKFPSKKTIIGKNCIINYKGKMRKAKYFLKYKGVKTVKHMNEQIMYNVLLEKQDTMKINNIPCKTLNINGSIATLCRNVANQKHV